MTHILTRLYADEKTANGVRERLFRAGFPRHVMRVVTLRDNETHDSLMTRITRIHVPDRAASVYTESVASGNALLVVEAGYKPLSARKIGVAVLEQTDDMPSNLESQDFKIGRIKDHAPRVMKDHPRFFTASPDPDHIGGPLSDQFGFNLVSTSNRRLSVGQGGPMFPFAALTKNRNAKSAMSGGGFMSRIFWPMKLVTNARRRRSVIAGGGTPFSRLLGMRTTSQ
jgi:hypothetical protein